MRKNTRQVNIRLSESEYNLLLEKAKSFNSTSAMLRTAINEFDNIHAKSRLEIATSVIKNMEVYNYELKKIGNNLNQITKNANTLIMQDKLNDRYIIEHIEPVIKQIFQLQEEYIKSNKHLIKKIFKH